MRIAKAISALGYLFLFIVGLNTLVARDVAHSSRFWGWVTLYALFAVAYHVGASAPLTARRRRIAALAVMTPAMLGMAALEPCQFGSMSLIIVASQAALLLSPRQTLVWVGVQTASLGTLLVCSTTTREDVVHVLALLGLQGFAAVAVHAARREEECASELQRTNGELIATRALLAEKTRAHERVRIARELHDVLGHDLTALGLQLEVATHVPPEEAAVYVKKAQEVSARLLANVRDVVSATRASEGMDLRAALQTLAESAPQLCVEIDMASCIRVDDDARAHCVLRCVQELITNTQRHAHASTLTVRIRQESGVIILDARDDGRGSTSVNLGSGLSGMRARLAELGGALTIEAQPQRPFVVTARLPLTAECLA